MIKRMAKIVAVVLMLSIGLTGLVLAQPRRDAKFRHTDKNKDGIIQPVEARQEHPKKVLRPLDSDKDGIVDVKERTVAWRRANPKVNTPLEAKHDANGDGWLQPEEMKALLRERHLMIKTHGEAKVDTPAEAEYDANKDGLIDITEAEVMMKDTE